MKTGINITGTDELLAKIQSIQSKEKDIERAGVVAGCKVMLSACRNAAPGSIKNEVGMSIRKTQTAITGKVGLTKFPRKNNRYHGIYLERGTKFIAPRRFIQNALNGSRAAAKLAIQEAIRNKMRELD